MENNKNNPVSKAIVIRQTVSPKSNYRDYFDELRFDFFYSCSYCSMTELEAQGLGFEIDHYFPQKHYPELKTAYDNLMWSCKQCNGRKSDFYPTERHKQEGNIVIRPDKDDPRRHFQLNDLHLEPETQTGKFNIALLDLNRQTLWRLREIRKKTWDSRAYLVRGVLEILQISVDQLPQELRGEFLRVRSELIQKYANSQQVIKEFVRQMARSPLLDVDTEKKRRLKKRRDYLKEIGAVSSDYELPEIFNPNKQVKKGRKKRKKGKMK